ncbi:putative biorientation of chromosomes in cell division protein 1-like 1 isoform X4 [Penaeus vannamei]|uniref:Putative biorientation of chromosomes in cell division protein 1-like 1 isoform X4 n=1 Tax=Penaeus vannamei TaxID=6689 RepID=A0A423TYP1_PENVA|nr:putative biorientation of chromosomes in cell division protein 1-like 1 isoform X4 [Penaeus vannamei]
MKAVYLNRDDILEKHVGPRVRSFDASKMKNKFEKPKQVSQMPTECKQCGKQVFQMERIVAERAAWHKNCFRCTECNTILTLETYQSHEGVLYCKPHFRDLFRPKAVVEDPMEARKDRTTDRPDYGLEELSTANVRQKFAMFEQAAQEDELQADPAQIRRSNSLLNRAARQVHPDASCWGKNISTREMFESGSLDGQNDKNKRPEQINIEGRPATKNLRERFEKGELGGSLDDQKEVDEVFRNSETASKARNLFKQMESGEGQENDERATAKPRENRLSKEVGDGANGDGEEEGLESSNILDRFKFFATYEERVKEQERKKKKVFRITPPRDGAQVDEELLKAHMPKRCMAINCPVCRLRGCDDEEVADFYGRDPNLVKYTDNLEEPLDCRKTKSVLAMFRKMEMQEDDDAKGPRPLKRFTPPPEGLIRKSARKAASLRAKFERWESEVEHNNEYNRNERNEDDEECMPSIDTARNLRAMFENKAQEASRPVVSSQPKLKVNRFVGGGGDKCLSCDRTVYAMERLEVAGRVLHKNCFKCCKCSTKLSMNSFSIGGEDIYCMTHYKQAFTEKGTYDVFTPNKGKWTRKIEATSSELAKSQE